MSIVLTLVLTAAVATASPMALEAERDRDTLRVSFRLLGDLPPAMNDALPSGVVVRIHYPLRVRIPRRLWWDRKVWKGEVVTVVVFDPVTGRYRGEVILDGVIVTSRELADSDAARDFLTDPGAVLLSLPPSKRAPALRVRVRAVFDSSTKWLFFPSVDGTEWVEIDLPQPEQSSEAEAAN